MSRVPVFLTASALMLSSITIRPQQLLTDPKAMLSDLIAQVIQLNLKAGISNSFDAKLSAATGALDDSRDQNDQAAINAMNAFINAVNAQRTTRCGIGPAVDKAAEATLRNVGQTREFPLREPALKNGTLKPEPHKCSTSPREKTFSKRMGRLDVLWGARLADFFGPH